MGSYGNIPSQFSLTFPRIDYYEKEDLFFVVDKMSNVQVFDKNGKFLLKFGSKGTEMDNLRPEDLTVDSQGRIFFCDTGNSRIQIVTQFTNTAAIDL